MTCVLPPAGCPRAMIFGSKIGERHRSDVFGIGNREGKNLEDLAQITNHSRTRPQPILSAPAKGFSTTRSICTQSPNCGVGQRFLHHLLVRRCAAQFHLSLNKLTPAAMKAVAVFF